MPIPDKAASLWRPAAILLLSVFVGIFLYRTTWAANRFQADDAFIAFRIAKNIGHGHGPYFNLGSTERTNTSIIHPTVLSLFFMGDDDERGIQLTAWFDIVTFLGTAILAALGAARLIRERFGLNPDLAFVLTFLLICSRQNVMYGMETQLYTLLIAGVFCLATWPGRYGWAFVLACLGPFIRPDGALLPLVTLVGILIFYRFKFNYARYMNAGAGLAVLYVVINLYFYHTLMPHTAAVKALLFPDKLHELRTYLNEILLPHNIPTYIIPFSLIGLVAAFRHRAGFIVAAFLVAYSAFFTAFNTWFFAFSWYRVPVILIFDVLAAIGLAWLFKFSFSILKIQKNSTGLRPVAATALCLVCLLYTYKSWDDARHELRRKVTGFNNRIEVSKHIGRYLRTHAKPGQYVFMEPLGIIGFYAWPVSIKDFPGLASQEVFKCLKGYGDKPYFFYGKGTDNLFYMLNCVAGLEYTVLREREYRLLQSHLRMDRVKPLFTAYGRPVDPAHDTFFRVFRTQDLLRARK